ncbi:bifunctional 2-polyprenyl-6-hydroxyphenol methylase/3-demethylubiquinol 3-O-methyltransferase UbiG [Desulforhopalus sp. IMCC35007]|uniref:class I SAM-dependent methyltransferase n=1 Tax=Desulforhopalus sp. IMCC35007 TaxID=2569543 RepID=UPI0010AE18B1|nr:methyltransferase domain-containing protein [Desulforhopalus sp. IMCC35007]TKB09619.1 methyltransferase domain-containing protein [Desulforhopalus sp. IMCC35007]
MPGCILAKEKDPLGIMLNDYFCGDSEAFLNVWSSTLEMSSMQGSTMFRSFEEMNELEKYALEGCRGRVLDVGAGSGCHSLVLQSRGLDVEAIDISPGCVEIMRKRSVKKTFLRHILDHGDCCYDTILMLMNGIGISGSLDGLNVFIQHLMSLLAPKGQLLVDSTDLTERFLQKAGEVYNKNGEYCGETDFVMIYKGLRSDPFSWLYVDFELLHTLCSFHGLKCDKLIEGEEKHYLARIYHPVECG